MTEKRYNCETDYNINLWVKKIGPVHIGTGKRKYRTDCGLPMLGNNYADCAVNREYCPICFPLLKGGD